MPFDLEMTHVIYFFAAVSAILFFEAIYLLFYSASSYRSRVNRRLRSMKDEPDRQGMLIQLRRERGLTSSGNYRLPLVSLNRLILQSGLTIGVGQLGLVAAAFVLLLFVLVWSVRGNALESAAIAIVVAVPFSYFVLRFLRARRQKRFSEQFPDAVDMIVRSLRAGHPVPVAVSMVGREMKDPIGTEFGIVADEITYGADIETAMRNLQFRVGQDDLPLFVTAIAIQGTTGGNLSEILANLSAVIRLRFKMRRKVRALAAEGRFSAIILSSLPVVMFIVLQLITPDFYGKVWQFDLTKVVLGCVVAWMAVGNYAMYRLVNFRV